jgi:hypothetical protein
MDGAASFRVHYREDRPAWMRNGLQAGLCDGNDDLGVVGESNYQAALWRLVGGSYRPDVRVRKDIHALILAEDGNPYDPDAVSVWIEGLKVGYLCRQDAKRYRPGLLSLQRSSGQPIAMPGVITGGGLREDGPGRLGVFLRHDKTDFGIQRVQAANVTYGGVRTGFSQAARPDDPISGHMSWVRDLPADDVRAIGKLRQLLARETDLISRHYMYQHLESLLYKSRSVFSSALEDYDQACRDHDHEMDQIRGQFISAWGWIPDIFMYRQMAIRQQKARNFSEALRWAERGIAVYGEHAVNPGTVQDLQQRSAAYKIKLVSR